MRSTDWRLVRLFGLAALGILLFGPGRGAAARKFDDKYAGSETCQTCHEDIYNNLLKSPHDTVENGAAAGPKGDWKGHACESCHGPGAKHAMSLSPDDIRNPAKLSVSEVDQRASRAIATTRPTRDGL